MSGSSGGSSGPRLGRIFGPQLEQLQLERAPGPGQVAGLVPPTAVGQFNLPQQLQLLAQRQQAGAPPLPFRPALMPNSMRIFQPSPILRR